MSSLLNAAKYLAKEYGFAPIYNDDEMFDAPLVASSQRNTFDALHLLACAANGSNPSFVSVQRVTDWLGQKAKSANV